MATPHVLRTQLFDCFAKVYGTIDLGAAYCYAGASGCFGHSHKGA